MASKRRLPASIGSLTGMLQKTPANLSGPIQEIMRTEIPAASMIEALRKALLYLTDEGDCRLRNKRTPSAQS